MNNFSTRIAMVEDAAGIATLTRELGYAAEEAVIRARLEHILARAEDCLIVAEDANARIGGWIHGFLQQLVESDFRVEIGGLVVSEAWRRKGVGKRLVSEIEAWGAKKGAREISVRCQVKRKEAHRFYESLGLAEVKTQINFRKTLIESPPRRQSGIQD